MTVDEMARDLLDDEFANWTRLGAYAIADHLQDMSEGLDEPTNWNRIDVRCDYSEYTLREVLDNFGDILKLDWQAVCIELASGGRFPIDQMIEQLGFKTGCVIHVEQGKDPRTGEMEDDTFIVSSL
jgi:hypothetical protein